MTARHQPERVETFAAWRIADSGEAETVALWDGVTLGEAVSHTRVHCRHKQHFCIRIADALSGRVVVRFYAVKQQSTSVWRKHEDGTVRAVRPMYAELAFSMQVSAFDPVEAWRWAPRADVVNGNDTHLRQVIEGKAHG